LISSKGDKTLSRFRRDGFLTNGALSPLEGVLRYLLERTMKTMDLLAAMIGLVFGLAIIGISKGNPVLFVATGQLYLGSAVAYFFSRLTFFK